MEIDRECKFKKNPLSFFVADKSPQKVGITIFIVNSVFYINEKNFFFYLESLRISKKYFFENKIPSIFCVRSSDERKEGKCLACKKKKHGKVHIMKKQD